MVILEVITKCLKASFSQIQVTIIYIYVCVCKCYSYVHTIRFHYHLCICDLAGENRADVHIKFYLIEMLSNYIII